MAEIEHSPETLATIEGSSAAELRLKEDLVRIDCWIRVQSDRGAPAPVCMCNDARSVANGPLRTLPKAQDAAVQLSHFCR